MLVITTAQGKICRESETQITQFYLMKRSADAVMLWLWWVVSYACCAVLRSWRILHISVYLR